jgi:hypothetical protein
MRLEFLPMTIRIIIRMMIIIVVPASRAFAIGHTVLCRVTTFRFELLRIVPNCCELEAPKWNESFQSGSESSRMDNESI